MKIRWTVMTVLALGVAGYAALVLLVPGFGPPFVADLGALMPVALAAHLAGGLSALALGPWQFNAQLRTRAIHVHRWIGRSYIVSVIVGGLGALRLAPVSQEGFVTHVGFGALAVLWLGTTVQAYRKIRADDQVEHRKWMIRSY